MSKIQENLFYTSTLTDTVKLHNRRYIGSKYKLASWIFSIIDQECSGRSFADIFAGTGVISAAATQKFRSIILNDFLYSNYATYKAFFGEGEWDRNKVYQIIEGYNRINSDEKDENYFSENFGGKYFSNKSARSIGIIREDIERVKNHLTEKEYYMLIASLLYATDKIANTVGHYDAYFKKSNIEDKLILKPISPIDIGNVFIYREDANNLVKKIDADIVYIDPPYNSRQYSRFYHVLETLTKWDKPKLFGVALKPEPENVSDFCKTSASKVFEDLISNINADYIVVSYNNTYNSKSSSSRNKIAIDTLKSILSSKGVTKIFETGYKHFNAGNTNFDNHKEYLFVTKV